MTDKTMIGVRAAQVYDLFALELLLVKGLEESDGLLPNYDPFHTYHHALKLIETNLVFVACEVDEAAKREKIIGCLMLDACVWPWNPRAGLLDSVHFYVLPEARGRLLPDGKTLVHEALIDAGKALADAHGCPLRIQVAHQMGPDNRAAAKDELLKRQGFAYLGGSFMRFPERTAESKAA